MEWDDVIYAGITLHCTEYLLDEVNRCSYMMSRDSLPYWRCSSATAKKLRQALEKVKEHVDVKLAYVSFADRHDRPLSRACEDLVRALDKVDALLKDDIFVTVNHLAEKISFNIIRRFERPPRFHELGAGRKAIRAANDTVVLLDDLRGRIRQLIGEIVVRR